MFNDDLSILTNQLLELLIVAGVLGQHLDLIGSNITGTSLALFTALEIVIGAIWALANDTEFARLHALDLGNLLKDLSGIELFHWRKYIFMYILYHKKRPF